MNDETSAPGAPARSALGSAMEKLADGMRRTAGTLDDRARRPVEPGPLHDLERAAADRLHDWSERVRQWDVEQLEERARAAVVRRPGTALLAAAAVGFLIGLWVRKS